MTFTTHPTKTWTVDEMIAEHPCAKYTRTRITALWAGQERLSLREILQLDIPAPDRMWVVWRPGAVEAAQRDALLIKIVTRAVERYALPHPVTAEWAKKWLTGEDRGEAAWAAGAAAAAGWAAWAATGETAEYTMQVMDAMEVTGK